MCVCVSIYIYILTSVSLSDILSVSLYRCNMMHDWGYKEWIQTGLSELQQHVGRVREVAIHIYFSMDKATCELYGKI